MQQTQQPPVTKNIEDIIDEKCRILNKNGTPKGGALHLAQWMKCQFDSQQQKHKNLINAMGGRGGAIIETVETESGSFRSDTLGSQADTSMELESDQEKEAEEDRIEDWTVEQVRKRSRELKLIDGSGHQVGYKSSVSPQSNQDDLITEDGDEERRSKSLSRSTTSDSQITVRSSPIITSNVVDPVSMCRQCHKHCKGNPNISGNHQHRDGKGEGRGFSAATYTRCCQSTTYSNSSASTTNKNNNNKSSSFTDSAVISSSDLRMSPKSAATKESYAYRNLTESPMYLQLNGSCTTLSSSVITTTPSIISSQSPKRLIDKPRPSAYCQCQCYPQDFVRAAAVSTDVIQQETCKLLENVHEVKRVHETGYVRSVVLPAEIKLSCSCETAEEESADQLAASDPYEDVPSIAIVPPTPDGKLQSLDSKDSPDSVESGQCEEPPYTVFSSASLRRYGTMSSLEKVPSDERCDSSDEDGEHEEAKKRHKEELLTNEITEHSEETNGEKISGDSQVITKRVYSSDEEATNASLLNWTARAGSYMADKISFFEESRAFFDKYMGRWEKNPNAVEVGAAGGATEGATEDCTSGATSGEDVWGTPSSGGENDEMQMFNSDQTQSVSGWNNKYVAFGVSNWIWDSLQSPTSSSFGDDDTELMMDELLMAPPMTASAVRGLLPRCVQLQ